jgi:hypothetical protein
MKIKLISREIVLVNNNFEIKPHGYSIPYGKVYNGAQKIKQKNKKIEDKTVNTTLIILGFSKVLTSIKN